MAKLNNRFWFRLHGWFSLPVWVLFCFICVTGTIAVISHELTWLTNANARASNPDNLPMLSAAQVVEKVTDAYPGADVSGVIILEPYLVQQVMFADADKPYAVAYVNPYSGAIQEVNDGNTFINFMRALHSWLLFPWQHNFSVGYYLVCCMAIVMLGAVVTGMLVYKKFWRAMLSCKVRYNQGSRTLLTDLHRQCGVWSIWFLLVMSLTGLFYFAQAILWHADIEIDPWPKPLAADMMPLTAGESADWPVKLADALTITQQQYPGFQPSYILLPEHNRDTFKLAGHLDELFYDQYSYGTAINPWSGAIEQQLQPDQMNGLQTLMHIADPLHFGTVGGLATKLIWFVFGLIVSGMSITGFLIWRGRLLKASQPRSVQTETLPEVSHGA